MSDVDPPDLDPPDFSDDGPEGEGWWPPELLTDLLTEVAAWLDAVSRLPQEQHACCDVCPLCRLVRAIGRSRPDAAQRVTATAGLLALALGHRPAEPSAPTAAPGGSGAGRRPQPGDGPWAGWPPGLLGGPPSGRGPGAPQRIAVGD